MSTTVYIILGILVAFETYNSWRRERFYKKLFNLLQDIQQNLKRKK